MINLDTPIIDLTKVGKATAGRLAKINLKTAGDLLWHLPRRFEDWSEIKDISDLKTGQQVTVQGRVELIANRWVRAKKMRITECLLSDESGSVKIIWFNQPYLLKQLKNGDEISVSGKVDNKYFVLQFTNPGWEKKSSTNIHTGRIVPIYPLTEGLTQKQLRFLIKQVLPLAEKIEDYLPSAILNKQNLVSLPKALQKIHWPKILDDFSKGVARLKFDELFFLQLVQLKNRQSLKRQQAPMIEFKESATKKLVKNLPFELTDDQRKVAWQILKDIAKGKPMNRLLQGDVGSGKTVVAAIVCLNTALAGYQAAIVAPTEILASQHWLTFKQILKNFNITAALFTRTQRETNIEGKKNPSKKKLLELIAAGKVQIVIGTHTLLQQVISFVALGLIVVDEQHRFGVKQRAELISRGKKNKNKKAIPHFLSMTATPIPRSLSLALYGDLDISIIKQKPKGRKDVITKFVKESDRKSAYDFMDKQIKLGRQMFVICPLIDESDKLGVKSATEVFKNLKDNIFLKHKVGLLHGRLKADIKQQVMADFKNGKIDILVATSVVEVGVDVANAAVMMVEGAERFGLAQLHQFRGRVGRSDAQSYCFLFASDNSDNQRLKIMTETNDGLKLAEYDLRFRGSGDIYGTRQSGFVDLKIATFEDLTLIESAKQAASAVINDLDKYPLLNKEFIAKQSAFHLE